MRQMVATDGTLTKVFSADFIFQKLCYMVAAKVRSESLRDHKTPLCVGKISQIAMGCGGE